MLPDSAMRHPISLPQGLQGRGGAVRYKTDRQDVLIVVAYVPPGVESSRAQQEAPNGIHRWLVEVIAAQSARTVVVLGLDANGKVGMHWCGQASLVNNKMNY